MRHILRSLAVLTPLFVALAAGNCSPTPPLDSDIEIRQGGALLWSHDVPVPGQGESWEFPNLGAVPGIGFSYHDSNPATAFEVRFRSREVENAAMTFPVGTGSFRTPLTFRRRPELHLFTRDPSELYDTLVNVRSVDLWDGELQGLGSNSDAIYGPPYTLPADVVLPYGQAGAPDLWNNHLSVSPLRPELFWLSQSGAFYASPDDWSPPGTWPNQGSLGFGSLKALRLINLPLCSTSIPIQPQLDTLGSRIQSALQGSCATALSIFLEDLVATTFLNHDTNGEGYRQASDQGLAAGVLLGGKFNVHVSAGPLDSSCRVTFKYRYEFEALGGSVEIKATRLALAVDDPTALACNGFVGFDKGWLAFVAIIAPGLGPKVAGELGLLPSSAGAFDVAAKLLEVLVPALVHDQVNADLWFPPTTLRDSPPFDTAAKVSPWRCRYPLYVNPATGQPEDECAKARSTLLLELDSGWANTHSDGSSTPVALTTAVKDPSNWRCDGPTSDELGLQCQSQGGDNGLRGYCQFRVPVTGVTMEVDELRVSSFDDFLDYANGANGLVRFYQSFAGANGPSDPTLYQQLCDPPVEVSSQVLPTGGSASFYTRYYATFEGAQAKCGSSPLAAGIPAYSCPCTVDDDCLSGDQCVGNVCRALCNANVDCMGANKRPAPAGSLPRVEVGDQCYPTLHLCGRGYGSGNCGATLACPPWEDCINSGGSHPLFQCRLKAGLTP